MLQLFVRTPLRFWFRLGIAASIIWVVLATLWHWTAFGRETASAYMHHSNICRSNGSGFGSACMTLAQHQLDAGYENAWFMAIAESLLQLSILWFVGVVIVIGTRWAAQVFEPAPSA